MQISCWPHRQQGKWNGVFFSLPCRGSSDGDRGGSVNDAGAILVQKSSGEWRAVVRERRG